MKQGEWEGKGGEARGKEEGGGAECNRKKAEGGGIDSKGGEGSDEEGRWMRERGEGQERGA